jgi:Cyclic nucleotide-binding domain
VRQGFHWRQGAHDLKPGDYFGEIALIDAGTRMASIIASTELVCYELTSRNFRSLVESNGVVGWKLLQQLTTSRHDCLYKDPCRRPRKDCRFAC